MDNFLAENIKVLTCAEAFAKRPEMFAAWVKEMKEDRTYDDWEFKEEYEEWTQIEKE